MDVFEASIINTKTGETINSIKMSNSNPRNGVYAEGGNKDKSKLPMIFKIRGDFTFYNESCLGKSVRFKTGGFDEEVKLVEMTNEMIVIETSLETGKKLRAAGF